MDGTRRSFSNLARSPHPVAKLKAIHELRVQADELLDFLQDEALLAADGTDASQEEIGRAMDLSKSNVSRRLSAIKERRAAASGGVVGGLSSFPMDDGRELTRDAVHTFSNAQLDALEIARDAVERLVLTEKDNLDARKMLSARARDRGELATVYAAFREIERMLDANGRYIRRAWRV